MKSKINMLILGVIAISFLIVSCEQKAESPILKEKFEMNNLPELVEKIKSDNNLTIEEIDLFNGALQSNATRLDSIDGKTIGEIINTYKTNLKKLSVNKFLNTTIAMSVASRYVGWLPDSTNKTDIDAYKILLGNRSKKEMKRIFGRLTFFTNKKQIMGVFDINLLVKLPAGEQRLVLAKVTKNTQNKNVARIRQILETQPNTLYAQWQVLEVEFADGKLISILNKKNKETAEK